MQQKLFTKLLSIMLTLCLVFAMIPVTAFAETDILLEGSDSRIISSSMTIGGQADISLTGNASGDGWTWDAEAMTLTLDSGYSGTDGIMIHCAPSDTINLALTGDVSVWNTGFIGTGCPLWVGGSLNIDVAPYTLDVSSDWPGIEVKGDLTIQSGTVKAASNDGANGIDIEGDVTISGSANADITGSRGNGLQARGNILIDTTGTVVANGGASGIISNAEIKLMNGTITSNGGSNSGMSAESGIAVTGGTLITNSLGNANGDVKGSLTVNGTDTNVTINGNIVDRNGADLTVSGGTVDVTGTVAGTIEVTDGIVSVNGQNIPPWGSSETIIFPGYILQNDPLSGSNYQSLFPAAGKSGNSVTVNSGTIAGTVYGGYDSGSEDVSSNTTIVNGGEITGSVNYVVSGGRTYLGNASNNTIVITGGTIRGFKILRGGESMLGNVENNHTIITGGTIEAQVESGISGLGLMRNNRVSIREGNELDLSASTFSGCSASGSVMNIERAGVTVRGIGYFNDYNFKFPSSISNSSVMLISTQGDGSSWISPVDVGGANIGISLTDTPALVAGDKIILIDSTAEGMIGTPANSTVSVSGYTFSITVEDGRLEALVVTAPHVEATAYPVNVTNGTANPASAVQGTVVTLTADPASGGQRFKEWSISPSVIFVDGTMENSETAKFTMPAQAITAIAVYEDIPTQEVAVTSVDLDKTSLSLYSNTTPNTERLTAAVSPSNASNRAVIWESSNTAVAAVDQDGNVTAVGNGTAMLLVTTMDGGFSASCTVTVTTYQDNAYNGSSGSGIRRTAALTSDTGIPVTSVIEADCTVDKDGNLSVHITEIMVEEAIEKAKAEAKLLGKTAKSIRVEIKTAAAGCKSMTAAIDAPALRKLNTGGTSLTVISPVCRFTLDSQAIKEAAAQSAGTVTLSAAPVTELSDEAKALIRERPVLDFTVSYHKNGITEFISNFNRGRVTLGIPYTSAAAEKNGGLYIVYVDGEGKPQLLDNSSYTNSWMIWSRNTLSTYGVGYKAPVRPFIDTANHWAEDSIDFAASRGLITGVGNIFDPNSDITRADILMAFGKLGDVDVSSRKTSSFTDVKDSDPAMAYIEWAVENKILQDTGSSQFGPTQSITREQMAVMIVNYAKSTGYTLPAARQYNAFTDDEKISIWAEAAVKAIQQAGLIMGKDGNKFAPQENVTRSEASAILHRYAELVIEESTARGWVKNDSGQWQYYNELGKCVTGWFSINDTTYYFDNNGIMLTGKWHQIGGKWYCFYADGKMARNTTIENDTVGADGARQEKERP